MKIAAYVLVMAGVTYLIRMLPFTLIRKKIKSKTVKSFLYYLPYCVLSAMTFPSILYCTDSLPGAAAGTACAVLLAALRLPLIVVAIAASALAYVVPLIL